jgi:Ca-activated chloride channel family protein
VVLLTDGKNEYPADTDLDGLVRELQAGGEDVAVRVFPIAYGEDADFNILKRIAEASRAAAYNSADPASIDKVFTAVVSNF